MKLHDALFFDAISSKTFNNKSFSTLSDITDKVRIELGGENSTLTRVNVAYERALNILLDLYKSKEIWLRIIVWDNNIEFNKLNILDNAFFKFKSVSAKEEVLYYQLVNWSEEDIKKILKAVLSYDMAEEDGLNITCFYYCFEIPAVINIYDDRGMDIVTADKQTKQFLREKYEKFLTW